MISDTNLIEILVYNATIKSNLRINTKLHKQIIIIVLYDVNLEVGKILRLQTQGRYKRMTANTIKILYSQFIHHRTHSPKTTIESDIYINFKVLSSYKLYCPKNLFR